MKNKVGAIVAATCAAIRRLPLHTSAILPAAVLWPQDSPYGSGRSFLLLQVGKTLL